MVKKIRFSELPRDEQIALVRKRMEAGDSNTTAAEYLGTTPGTVAGIRFKHNIPSKNKSTQAMAKAKATQEPASVTPTVVSKPQAPRYVLAASEATQCTHEDETGRRCAYEKEPRSTRCLLHANSK